MSAMTKICSTKPKCMLKVLLALTCLLILFGQATINPMAISAQGNTNPDAHQQEKVTGADVIFLIDQSDSMLDSDPESGVLNLRVFGPNFFPQKLCRC